MKNQNPNQIARVKIDEMLIGLCNLRWKLKNLKENKKLNG